MNITMYSWEEIRNKVNEFISTLEYERAPRKLYEPITYTLQQGGKRIRPVIFQIGRASCRERVSPRV